MAHASHDSALWSVMSVLTLCAHNVCLQNYAIGKLIVECTHCCWHPWYCWVNAVAFFPAVVPAVAYFKAVTNVLAVASVLAIASVRVDPFAPILAGVFAYCSVQ